MDMEGVKGIADLMGDTRGQQGKGLHALALDCLEGFLPGFGGIMKDECHATAPGGSAIQRSSVQPQETRTGIVHLEFMADDTFAAGAIKFCDLVPLEARDKLDD